MTDQLVRIGDLLSQAGIISSDFIRDALQKYEQRGLPIGKVLVLSGCLTEQQLRTALEIQTMVNDGLLPIDVGTHVLRIAHGDNIALTDAFIRSGLIQPEDQLTNKLGQLLLDAEVIFEEDLEEALQTNQKTGLPLGHILCFTGLVSNPVIDNALLGQQLIRRGQLSKEQAVAALREAFARETTLEKKDINKGFQRMPLKGSPRFGEMLYQAKLLTEAQLMDTLMASQVRKQPIGQIMLSHKLVTAEIVEGTVELQEMLDNGTITLKLALEALLEVRAKSIPWHQAVAELSTYNVRHNPSIIMVELLTGAGLLPVTSIPRDVQERIDVNYNQTQEVCNILKEQKLVEDLAMSNALRLAYLVGQEFLTHEKAILALDYAAKTKAKIDYVMYMLGWVNRTRLRE